MGPLLSVAEMTPPHTANCKCQVLSLCLSVSCVCVILSVPNTSVVTNIASLVLGYDMRRLNDLTTFRRYWYRTSLIESFIGSKKPHQSGGEEQGEERRDDGTGNLPFVDCVQF